MDPGDLDLLCLYWQDSYFADCRVPFGYRNGSMFLTRFTDYMRYVMRCNSFTIVNYVDDLLGHENPILGFGSLFSVSPKSFGWGRFSH